MLDASLFPFAAVVSSYYIVKLLVLTNTAGLVKTRDQGSWNGCPNGMFGDTSCDLKCHCSVEMCDRLRGCLGQCEPGWFGPACQYKTSAVKIQVDGKDEAGDGSSHNCITKPKTGVKLTLKNPHPFNWLRIATANNEAMRMVKVKFWSQGVELCRFPHFIPVRQTYLDVYCATDVSVSSIQVTGVKAIKHICTVHVSQGREFVLLTRAEQSSTVGKDVCSPTFDGTNLFWGKVLPFPVDAMAITIYNTNKSDSLRGFHLVLDYSSKTVYSYTDEKNGSLEVYEIVLSARTKQIDTLKISARPYSTGLELCEVIVYGETVCSNNNAGRNCREHCNCRVGKRCIFTEGSCPKGSAICSRGTFGSKCQYQCRCLPGATCSPTNGECSIANDRGNRQGNCVMGWFGQGCLTKLVLSFESVSQDNLWDQDDDTCVPSETNQSVAVHYRLEFFIRWIRITKIITEFFKPPKLTLLSDRQQQSRANTICENPIKMDERTYDYFCQSETPTKGLEIDNVANLCGVYISAGRVLHNRGVLYKKEDYDQLDDYDVGSPGAIPESRTIMSGNMYYFINDKEPGILQFIRVVVNDRRCPSSHAFTVELQKKSSSGNWVSLGTNLDWESLDVEAGVFLFPVPFAGFSLRTAQVLISSVNGVAFSVCRVEFLGDRNCPADTFGLECEKKCHCADVGHCRFDGTCPNGCAPGYKGKKCQILGPPRCPIPGWYGLLCEYRCNCKGECDDEGHCSTECVTGWFGPECQFKTSSVNISIDGKRQRGNGASHKCLPKAKQRILLVLNQPHLFNWLRIRTSKTDAMKTVGLKFYLVNNTKVCQNPKFLPLDEKYIDVLCATAGALKKIIVTGRDALQHLCTIHISQGRNQALRSLASQSSTFGRWKAYHATDGENAMADNFTDQERTCTHTGRQNDVPHWKLSLPVPIDLFMIKIFNRVNRKIACCEKRLQGFKLWMGDGNKWVYNYTDQNPTPLDVYEIVFPKRIPPFHKLSVYAREDSGVLTLCEVEIYGESVCRAGSYGFQCTEYCNCHNGADCTKTVGACPHGCKAGFTGTDCKTECPKYYYGVDCKFDCRDKSHCKVIGNENPCNKSTGHCVNGCDDDMAEPFCDIPLCKKGLFGRQCQYECGCASGDDCHTVEGVCKDVGKYKDGCSPGWFGAGCLYKHVGFKKFGNYRHVPAYLGDGNYRTCGDGLGHVKEIRAELEYPILGHWIRIRLRVYDSAPNLTVRFQSKDGNRTYPCDNGRIRVDLITFDYICNTDNLVDALLLNGSWVSSICDVFVSAGRILYQQGVNHKRLNNTILGGNEAFSGEMSYSIRTQTPGTLTLVRIYFNKGSCRSNETFTMEMSGGKSFWKSSSITAPYSQGALTFVPTQSGAHLNSVEISISAGSNFSVCRVEFLGIRQCPRGKFGLECEKDCNCDDENDQCIDTGACPKGCRKGYKGIDCSIKCTPGFYGQMCRKQCSSHCLGGEHYCHSAEGTCTIGCEDGYIPPNCEKRCNQGYWGPNCKNRCGERCKSGTHCNSNDGSCPDGCEIGYLEPTCRYKCMETYYGQDCNLECSETCKNQACHHITGSCKRCVDGYIGTFCEACPKYHFGRDCFQNCSAQCANQTCETVEGKCLRCPPGYRGDFCNKDCVSGQYGQDCGFACSVYCKGGVSECDPVDGTCKQGCEGDRKPPFCIEQLRLKEGYKYGKDDPTRYAVISLVAISVVIIIAIYDRIKLSQSQNRSRAQVATKSTITGRTAQLNALWAEQQYPFLKLKSEENTDLSGSSSSGSSAALSGTYSAGTLHRMMGTKLDIGLTGEKTE